MIIPIIYCCQIFQLEYNVVHENSRWWIKDGSYPLKSAVGDAIFCHFWPLFCQYPQNKAPNQYHSTEPIFYTLKLTFGWGTVFSEVLGWFVKLMQNVPLDRLCGCFFVQVGDGPSEHHGSLHSSCFGFISLSTCLLNPTLFSRRVWTYRIALPISRRRSWWNFWKSPKLSIMILSNVEIFAIFHRYAWLRLASLLNDFDFYYLQSNAISEQSALCHIMNTS